MRKSAFLLILLIGTIVYAQEKKYIFNSKATYFTSGDQIISEMYVSDQNPDIVLFSFNGKYILSTVDTKYSIAMMPDQERIDYQKSSFWGKSSKRDVKIIATKEYLKKGNSKSRKFIFNLSTQDLIVYIDENSKINNVPALKAKEDLKEYADTFPKGLVVKVDIESKIVPEWKDYLILQKEEKNSNKVLYIDLEKLLKIKPEKYERESYF